MIIIDIYFIEVIRMSARASKRINIGLSDELYSWLASEAEKNGIPVSTYGTMLITQAKKSAENTEHIMSVFDVMKKMTPEQLAEVMSNSAAEMEQMKFENE